MIPGELRYTAEHEWVREEADGILTFGITHHAQEALGDIVFVSLPQVGADLTAGSTCGEVESTKSVSDIFAPISGEVAEVNARLETSPEVINASPYGDGWMVRVTPSDPSQIAGLLSAAEYEALTTGS
ncbi:MAG: glycine cleavage system protein GcvH [Actinomycetota bacterium]|jgi:glycine cleavage system H protein